MPDYWQLPCFTLNNTKPLLCFHVSLWEFSMRWFSLSKLCYKKKITNTNSRHFKTNELWIKRNPKKWKEKIESQQIKKPNVECWFTDVNFVFIFLHSAFYLVLALLFLLYIHIYNLKFIYISLIYNLYILILYNLFILKIYIYFFEFGSLRSQT